MRLENAVSLLFSWSQRADSNRGPTDYEFLSVVDSKGFRPLSRTNLRIFMRFCFPIRRKSAENSEAFGTTFCPESDLEILTIHRQFEGKGTR